MALDAARLDELPPGGNVVIASRSEAAVHRPRRGRRLAVVTLGARRARSRSQATASSASRPERSADDAPGSGDVFAATLLVALAQGDDLAGRARSCVAGRSRLARVNLALSLLYAAERNPDAEAVVDGEHRFTYAELRERAARLAGGLAREGLTRGERLAAVVRCRSESVQLYWACQWLGATFVPLSPRVSAADLAYCREDSGAVTLPRRRRRTSSRCSATSTRARSTRTTRTRA